jgi:hypothetical protein
MATPVVCPIQNDGSVDGSMASMWIGDVVITLGS